MPRTLPHPHGQLGLCAIICRCLAAVNNIFLEFPQKSSNGQAKALGMGEKGKLWTCGSASQRRKAGLEIGGGFTEQSSEASGKFIMEYLFWFSLFRSGNGTGGLTKDARYYRGWFLGDQGQIPRQQRRKLL